MSSRNKKARAFVWVVVAVCLVTPMCVQAQSWWDANWQYRKEALIDHNMVGSDLSSFPVLVSLASDTNLAAEAQLDGDDIAFADVAGAKLPHEIEYYDGATGALVAWVRMATVSSSADTSFYMYYGNASAPSQEDATGVWDTNFRVVQHLEEGSGTHYDSTSYGNDGDPNGALTQNTVGKIAGCDGFDGSTSYIDLGNGASINLGTGDFTIGAWFKTTYASWHYIAAKGGSTEAASVGYGFGLTAGEPYGFIHDGTRLLWNGGESGYNDGEWHHIVAVYDRDGYVTPYVDGNALTPTDISARPNSVSGTPNLIIGKYPGGGTWLGSIDEFRVLSGLRSADWIAAEFRNQNDPAAFYSIGTEETYTPPQAPMLSNPSPGNGELDVAVTLSQLSFSLSDAQSDPMDYTVTTSPDIGSGSGTGVGDGTYSMAVSGLQYGREYSWQVDVADDGNVAQYIFSFATELGTTFDPFDQGWQYRKQVTLDHTKVADDLTDFPVLIDVTDVDLQAGAQADGDDILFMDGSGVANRFSHEIEDYDSGTGHLTAWIRVPALSSIDDTSIYLYYGNGEVVSHEDVEGTWDSDFVMVQHLAEVSGTHYDSTANFNDGIAQNGLNQNAAGIINGADEFDGADDYIRVPDGESLKLDAHTIEMWVKRADAGTTEQMLLERRGTQTESNYFISMNKRNTQELFPGFSDGTNWYSLESDINVIGDMEWHHIAYTFDPVAGVQAVYLDAVNEGTNTGVTGVPSIAGTQDIRIGQRFDGTTSFHGIQDEVRLSSVPRGAAWISTGYANQSSPASFYSIGPEEQSEIQVDINIELQNFAGSSRDVTFVATGGLAAKSWTQTLSFTGGVSSLTLTDVPGGTTHLSAKTEWSLRRRLALSGAGTYGADFTGDNKLLGGDLNGSNTINILDYGVLKFNWLTTNPIADITGDGRVQILDYMLLRANWFKRGDPQ